MKKVLIIVVIAIIIIVGLVTLTEIVNREEEKPIVEENEIVEVEVVSTDDDVTEYKYKDLSFKLPNEYVETESDSQAAILYTQEYQGEMKKRFSIDTFPTQDEDFMKDAIEALKTYEFKLIGYKATSRQDPRKVEYSGMEMISVDVKYESPNVNGDAEIEFCFIQNKDTVYVIYFEMFAENGRRVEEFNFGSAFNDIKNSLKFE